MLIHVHVHDIRNTQDMYTCASRVINYTRSMIFRTMDMDKWTELELFSGLGALPEEAFIMPGNPPLVWPPNKASLPKCAIFLFLQLCSLYHSTLCDSKYATVKFRD